MQADDLRGKWSAQTTTDTIRLAERRKSRRVSKSAICLALVLLACRPRLENDADAFVRQGWGTEDTLRAAVARGARLIKLYRLTPNAEWFRSMLTSVTVDSARTLAWYAYVQHPRRDTIGVAFVWASMHGVVVAAHKWETIPPYKRRGPYEGRHWGLLYVLTVAPAGGGERRTGVAVFRFADTIKTDVTGYRYRPTSADAYRHLSNWTKIASLGGPDTIRYDAFAHPAVGAILFRDNEVIDAGIDTSAWIAAFGDPPHAEPMRVQSVVPREGP